ncbi:RNA-binding protein [Tritrichomonas foetus]|uniref:RNA-binding protein n=1 Tax=Tritrichomonas foetus TaxID=1144522 RepID=A0A1J4KS28_9EUKA|nr:RNA-binding protein [Tritrichomonas foetus]|eukprot:OHT14097.1 RNA-binding protein [Tritrichomonas foetus]
MITSKISQLRNNDTYIDLCTYPKDYLNCLNYEYLIKEIPCRALKMGNIPFNDFNEDNFKFVIEATIGGIEKIETEELSKGIAIIHFYDISDAMQMRLSRLVYSKRQIVSIFGEEYPVTNKKRPPNNGTIVVFNVPSNISDQVVITKFNKFGPIRQLRRTPKKETQRFIEFFDIRDADCAKNQLNRRMVNFFGCKSRISIDFSHPGSYRLNNSKYYTSNLPERT